MKQTLLEKYRNQLKLTIYSLGKKTRIRQSSIKEYEERSMMPSLWNFLALYNFFVNQKIEIDIIEFMKDFVENINYKKWIS